MVEHEETVPEVRWGLFINQEYDGRSRRCTLGLHPGDREDHGNCPDGAYAKTQCCVYTPCQRHKCGPLKGCKCPLPTEQSSPIED